MSKKLMFIEVRGNHKRWSFSFIGDTKYLTDWRSDGLEVNVIENSIPAWWVEIGLPAGWYCFWQDLFNVKNPWRKP